MSEEYTILAEECGELTQACCKRIRYGEGEEQRKKLVEDYLVKQNVFTYEELHARGHIKKEKLKIYSDLEL
jgi:hypothetical protein